MSYKNSAHVNLARFLYSELLVLDSKAAELATYGKMLDALVFYEGVQRDSDYVTINDELDGFILDLKHWVSLKRDEPEQAQDFGAGLKESYSDLLVN
ncbi:MAG TPA: hypothetical protein VJM32_04960 [Candidatus Saccharimonadales bacterium]|nr:hypothetical protein [Candidatus Saccharimonadales bacterium]